MEPEMDLELKAGRPADCSGRLEKEIRVYDKLDELGIEYYRVDHIPLDTMEACEAVERENVLAPATICKNLFLCNRQETRFFLLMMVADKKFKTSIVSKQIGTARLSFGSAENMERFLDITPGSMSVMGLMNDTEHRVELLIDEDILAGEYFGCHPCINTTSMRLKVKDLLEKFLPAVEHDFTAVSLGDEKIS